MVVFFSTILDIRLYDKEGKCLKIWTDQQSDELKLAATQKEELISYFPVEMHDRIITNREECVSLLKQLGYQSVEVDLKNEIIKKARREFIQEEQEMSLSDQEKLFDKRKQLAIRVSRKKIKRTAELLDKIIVQGIHFVTDLDKTINLFISRLREWYSYYFPELSDLVANHTVYARLVREITKRSNYTEENLSYFNFAEDKLQEIEQAARNSIGANYSDEDLEGSITLAQQIDELHKEKEQTERWIVEKIREITPNVATITGPLIAARLLSQAGGLRELSRFPSSTVQMLGAEKALFRALKSGNRLPKHGVIFQMPELHNSPWWIRGKIARAIAGKVSIAAKIDAYNGEFKGDELRNQIERKVNKIKKEHPEPPEGKVQMVYDDTKRGERGERGRNVTKKKRWNKGKKRRSDDKRHQRNRSGKPRRKPRRNTKK